MRGGLAVLEEGARPADIVVADGRIAAIEPALTAGAETALDARGLVVLPGLVDAHVHFNEPGRTEWEGWAAGTRGAAAGGVTTVLDMPLNSLPPTTDGASFDAKLAAAEASAVVDFGLWGGLVDADAERLEALRARGAVAVKAFMSSSGVSEFPRLEDDELDVALAAAAAAGLLVGVHAEDEATTLALGHRLRAAGRRDPQAWVESRPASAEVAAVDRLAASAARARARIHVVHASSAQAVERVRAASAGGVDATVETCPHYLAFDADDVARLGPYLKCAPPVRDDANQEWLWAAVLAGEVDLIASDHSPCPVEDKRAGDEDIWRAWGGVVGVQSMLPVLLTEGVHQRRMSLELLARLAATNPARRFGLYPRKGAIRVGADADLVLVDLEREWTFSAEDLFARSGVSPYLGRRFRGAVVRTMVQGRTVCREAEIVVSGGGRLVRRDGP